MEVDREGEFCSQGDEGLASGADLRITFLGLISPFWLVE
jgi:hypothetical protein